MNSAPSRGRLSMAAQTFVVRAARGSRARRRAARPLRALYLAHRGLAYSVQVLRMKAFALRCSSTRSSTSSGLIGRMPGNSAASVCP